MAGKSKSAIIFASSLVFRGCFIKLLKCVDLSVENGPVESVGNDARKSVPEENRRKDCSAGVAACQVEEGLCTIQKRF